MYLKKSHFPNMPHKGRQIKNLSKLSGKSFIFFSNGLPKVLITQLDVSYNTKMNPADLYNTDGNFVTLVLTENFKSFIKIQVTYISLTENSLQNNDTKFLYNLLTSNST
jgi:hypothetical protein